MIAIIDYDAGNIKSVEKALLLLGQKAVITGDREEILKADKVILPGVGAFGDAMANIRKKGLDRVIREVTDRGTPFLGICLGLQVAQALIVLTALGAAAVLAFAIGIAFEDDGSRIIEQELLRNATEKHEGLANTGEPCLAVLALTEAHVGGAAVAERGDKCLESEPPASDGGEVDLHLMAWWGLEANNGIIALRLERTHIGLELGNAAVIAELLQFA